MGVLLAMQQVIGGVNAHGFAYTNSSMIGNLRYIVDGMLANTMNPSTLHIDVTFKHLYNGWVTLVIAASVLVYTHGQISRSDLRFSVLPIMMANFKTENGDDVAQALKGFALMLKTFCPDAPSIPLFGAMMSDASEALANAASQHLTKYFLDLSATSMNCYFHVTSNVKKNKAKLHHKAHHNIVKRDVRRLHNSPTKLFFHSLAQATLTKWVEIGM